MSETPATLPDAAAKATSDLLAKVTARWGNSQAQTLAPLVVKYGPQLAAMTAQDAMNWLQLALSDEAKAYAAMLKNLTNADLVDQWAVINAREAADVDRNAERMAWQRDVAGAFVGAFAKILIALVGL